VPNKSTIQRLVKRFRDTGSIGEKRLSGRPSVLSNDSLEDIRHVYFSLQENHKESFSNKLE
jgi:transposase